MNLIFRSCFEVRLRSQCVNGPNWEFGIRAMSPTPLPTKPAFKRLSLAIFRLVHTRTRHELFEVVLQIFMLIRMDIVEKRCGEHEVGFLQTQGMRVSSRH